MTWREKIKISLEYKDILILLSIYLFLWLIIGGAFFCLVKSVYYVEFSEAIFLWGIFSISWVVGFLSFITPGGMGVREGLLAILLSMYMPITVAIIISLIVRVWSVAGDLIMAGLSMRFKLEQK